METSEEIENIYDLCDYEGGRFPQCQDTTESSHTDANDAPTRDASSSAGTSTQAPTCRIGVDTSKAGMEGLDKDRIDQIIIQASMGSKFYKNEVRKEKQLAARIEQMKKALEAVTPAQQLAFCRSADSEIESLERARNLGHIIVHIDMDAFYAAVEMRDDPSLRDVPMAVGGMGMLSTSNYLARRFGVRAAMPGFIGKKLCPDLVIVKPNYNKYQAVSKQVHQVLEQYDPDFCPIGLDEAYLDLTSYVTAKITAQNMNPETTPSKMVASNGISGFPDNTSSSAHLTLPSSHGADSGAHLSLPPSHGSQLTLPPSHGSDSGAHMTLPPSHGSDSGAHMTLPPSHGSHQILSSPSHRDAEDEEDLTLPSYLPDVAGPPQLPRAFWECAQAVVMEIRERVWLSTGLTASAGIAANKMVAKIACDKNKPNGQCYVEPTRDAILQFVWQLPIRKISGVGKVTEKTLASLGITTCKQLYEKRGILPVVFSKASCDFFFRVSLGISSFSVNREHQRKSMSTERTFAVTSDPIELQEKCLNLCQALVKDIQEEGLWGSTVTLKLKTDMFEVRSRAVTLPTPVASLEQLHQAASRLLAVEISSSHPRPLSLRLMGVRVSSFKGSSAGSSLGTLDGLFQTARQKGDQSGGRSDGSISKLQETGPPCREHCPGAESTHNTKCCSAHGEGPTCSHDDPMEGGGGRLVMLKCPVCGRAVSTDNMALNQHIDECLNVATIHSLRDTSRGLPDTTHCGTQWTHTRAVKRKSSNQTRTFVKKPTLSHTLDHFWSVA